ncbi:hypothetical protein CFP56_043475 [Quercus suber]|uniref:Uncharacterized protein n=1 Tax=Quercus suber TaxID=58331 RepID=A0AAW0LH69_QUESU|nr:hypothetical protein CFP56_41920 [Quercus suber]
MTTATSFCGDCSERELMTEEPAEALTRARDERDVSELLRKWQRSKRKAIYLHEAMRETVGSSTSSMSVTREDTSTVVDEDAVDSESVCLGGRVVRAKRLYGCHSSPRYVLFYWIRNL